VDFEFWGHRPAPPLDAFVEDMWLTLSPRPVYRALRVIPNGRLLLMFNLGGPQGTVNERGGVDEHHEAWACGAHARPLTVAAGPDHRLVGVRFRPGGARPFLVGDLTDLTDRVVPLDAAWGNLVERVRDRIAAAPPGPAVFRIVEEALHERAGGVPVQGALVGEALRRLATSHGRVRIEGLAKDLGVTTRHLLRVFAPTVGLRPKVAARVVRFQHVLRAVAAASPEGGPDWAGLAHEHGYADQPHLAAEFRALAGLTPSAYRAARRAGETEVFVD
jgi:AraC-like DNA-binding protein